MAAIRLITDLRPDVVFLDIKMPDLDGFGVLDRVAAIHLPSVIFVTTHDRFALQAFERHAADYLLKPFTRSRCASALARLRHGVAVGEHEASLRLMALLDERQPRVADTGSSLVPSPRRSVFELNLPRFPARRLR